jgi:hypothetical protein
VAASRNDQEHGENFAITQIMFKETFRHDGDRDREYAVMDPLCGTVLDDGSVSVSQDPGDRPEKA